MDHLELSPITSIILSWVTDISGKDDKDTKFSIFFINLDVEYRDFLGTKETSEMPEILGFRYTVEVVCHDKICIAVPLLYYWERNGSEKFTTCNKINYETAVVNVINNAVNDYYQRKGGYNEAQHSSKEFMIKLTSKHDKIELDSGYLLRNRSSEKRSRLVSTGCLFKVDNDILTKTTKR